MLALHQIIMYTVLFSIDDKYTASQLGTAITYELPIQPSIQGEHHNDFLGQIWIFSSH